MSVATTRERLLDIYANTRTIAVVGASTKEDRPAHYIPAYLASQGFRVIPVSPRPGTLFGETVVPSLKDVKVPIDVVEVFRPPDEAETVAREAVAAGAKVLWFQPGTDSPAGVRVAAEAGLQVVTGRCMGVTHGELGLGPGP